MLHHISHQIVVCGRILTNSHPLTSLTFLGGTFPTCGENFVHVISNEVDVVIILIAVADNCSNGRSMEQHAA